MSGFSAPPPSLPLSLVDAPTGEELSLEHVGAGLAGIFWRGVKMLEFGTSLKDMAGNELQAPLGMAGETWKNVKGSRSRGTAYQNTTGRPMQVALRTKYSGGDGLYVQVSSDGSNWLSLTSLWGRQGATPIIPPGHFYRITGGSDAIDIWLEFSV